MTYDPDLYSAELHRSMILIRYHLRQIQRAKDVTTAKTFSDALAVLGDDARKTYRDVQKERSLVR